MIRTTGNVSERVDLGEFQKISRTELWTIVREDYLWNFESCKDGFAVFHDSY